MMARTHWPDHPAIGATSTPDDERLGVVREKLVVLVRRRIARYGAAARIDVEDVVQEAICRMLEAIRVRQFDGTRPFWPYLVGIVNRVVIDDLRRKPVLGWPAHEIPGLPGDQDDRFADRAALLAALEGVHECLQDLPGSLRDLYEERFVRGHAQRTAAINLRLTHRKLRTLEGRLISQLRKKFCEDL
jgi:RNA polymerase sigma factor (sigma-70 family)